MKFLNRAISSATDHYFNDRLPGWRLDLSIGLTAFVISLFFAFPSLWQWLAGDPNRINEFLAQAENPWRRDLTEPILYYRFLVPLVNHGLGIKGYWAVLPGITASFLNLCLLSRLVRQRTQNIAYTLLLAIGFGFTFFIVEGTTFWCSPDSVAHLFVLLVATFDFGLFGLVLMPLCALLVDERSIAAFAFLCVFRFHHIFRRRDFGSAVRSVFPLLLGILLALMAWRGVRLSLEIGVWSEPFQSGLLAKQSYTVLASFQPLDGWAPWILNVLAAFKWMYIFPLLLTASIFNQATAFNFPTRSRLNPVLPIIWSINLCLFTILLFASMFNGDVWRTISFGYLFLVEASISLYGLFNLVALRIATVTAILMFATPVVYVGADLTARVAYPMPVVLWRTFFGGKGALSWLLSLIGIHRGGY